MQTITEKEVNAGLTQASDAAFINAFTADGTPIKISKADLASVVAGLMTQQVAEKTDVDTINYTSLLFCLEWSGTLPSLSNKEFCIITFVTLKSGSYFHALQLGFHSGDLKKLYVRFHWWSGWRAWTEVLLS